VRALVTAVGVMALAAVTFARVDGKSGMTSAAEKFVYQAAITNLFGIDAAGRAETNTWNPAYRNFAKTIIADYGNLRSSLKKRVRRRSDVAVPTTLDYAHRQRLAELGSETGAKFEKDYRQSEIDRGRQALRLYQDFATDSSNAGYADLKSWAAASIPIVRKDLRRAEALPENSRQADTARSAPGRTKSSARALVDKTRQLLERWKKKIVKPLR
jgi:predicted outer membrane protein